MHLLYTGTWFEIINNPIPNRIDYYNNNSFFFVVVLKFSRYFSNSTIGKIFRQDNKEFNRKL